MNSLYFFVGEFRRAFFFIPTLYFYEDQTGNYILLTFLCFAIGIKWN